MIDKKYYAKVGDVISIPKHKNYYVVESAKMTGGSTGHDAYPDAWYVRARTLAKDESYDPKGRIIKFVQHTNCHYGVIEGVRKVGKKKRVIDFID